MNARAWLLPLVVAVSAAAAEPVRVWETNLVIPTYLAAPPSPVPRFYEGRTYQGAKATFYPYPVQDVLTDVKSNVTYRALFLENQYLQICVLPELGGRIFSAVDKTNGYDFFYRQHVIKPALIGMLGAWISGGVEWNVPHHHRATSFSPVDSTTQTNADGSATIWVGEIELRSRMKWLVGMTLYPDRSYLELTCKMFNRTPFAWPMLFWINAAVHANENYQVIFPPGTEWAAQHAKPEFACWPIAHQFYGGTDYTRGVDISWWKNHPNPVSFFAWNYEDDWFGGYDHGRGAGVVQVSDHHVAPGKKFFEWGNGPEGETWSKILTDKDGPYLELMAGAWSDNQPDYSWIQPGETREWKHWWYPVRNLGGIKAATRDLAVNLEVTNRTAKITVNATRSYTNVMVFLGWRALWSWRCVTNIAPDQPLCVLAPIPEPKDLPTVIPTELELHIAGAYDSLPFGYAQKPPARAPMPKAVEKPKAPKDYASADELYFTGQRIEQLYSPSFEAQPYYDEMLRRDPGDYRANTAMGILLCKQWRWAEAEKYLKSAIDRATANYIRPKDTEAFYYLGVALRAKGHLDEASEAFQKALWSPAWQPAAWLALAEMDCSRGWFSSALHFIERCMNAGPATPGATELRAALLRHLGDYTQARRWAEVAIRADRLNFFALNEAILSEHPENLASEDTRPFAALEEMMRDNAEAYLELATSYENAGLRQEAMQVLRRYPKAAPPNPLILYHLGVLAGLEGGDKETDALQFCRAANRLPPDYCFPSRFEDEKLLRLALYLDDDDARVRYYLGNLLYDNNPAEALGWWQSAVAIDPRFALVHRNLGLAYAQYEHDIPKAIASLEQAVELDPSEPRFFYELDREYEANGTPVARRLDLLLRHAEVVARRDDALTREIELLIVAGLSDPPKLDRAVALLTTHHFRNWEGSGQIHNVYVDALLARGQVRLKAGEAGNALKDFQAALEFPENLEVGRARRSPRNAQIQYLIGVAQTALGDSASATAAFEKAANGRGGGSESDYFRGLAMRKLGREADAKPLFERLIKAGESQLARGEPADYFAKFGEKQSDRVRQANGHYLIGLGRLGLGAVDLAKAEFKQALERHPAHLGAAGQSVEP